ncbi:MAG: peptide ABC transporter substrate-binding protein, partial [Bradyrhizobium sp.]|nr:peptide ABC transporter substrate-binding protein [Bradyrhizobium sp.]
MTEAYFDSSYSRRNALRLMVAGAAGLAAPGLLGTPAFAQKAPAKPSGRIVVGLGQEPTVFNPLMVHIEVDDGVHFSVFDALFRIDPKGEIQPNLAVEVPNQKNGGISEDGLKWRIRLRHGVRWHDGKPFTAEDVKFTLELITNPAFRSWRTAGHALVRDITVMSPTEISWRMEQVFAPYLSFLTETFIVPKHILEKEANPNNAAFNQAPVGTGAFKWGQRVAGDHLELVANS